MNIQKVCGGRFIGHKKHPFEIDFQRPITVLTGPNGSGKTLLMELIYSLIFCGKNPWKKELICEDDPGDTKIDWFEIYLDTGDIIKYKDGNVSGWKEEFYKGVGFVSEFIRLTNLDELSPVDYEYMLSNSGIKRKKLFKDRLLEIMNSEVLAHKSLAFTEERGLYFDLEKGLKLPTGYELSRGEARVLEVLHAVAITENILFIDIPDVAVHIGLQEHFIEWMEELKEPGLQIIFSTHSPCMLNGNWSINVDLYDLFYG